MTPEEIHLILDATECPDCVSQATLIDTVVKVWHEEGCTNYQHITSFGPEQFMPVDTHNGEILVKVIDLEEQSE